MRVMLHIMHDHLEYFNRSLHTPIHADCIVELAKLNMMRRDAVLAEVAVSASGYSADAMRWVRWYAR